MRFFIRAESGTRTHNPEVKSLNDNCGRTFVDKSLSIRALPIELSRHFFVRREGIEPSPREPNSNSSGVLYVFHSQKN